MTSRYRAGEFAPRIGADLVGDAALELTGIAPLERAGPNDVSFYADARFADRLAGSAAGAVIVKSATDAPGRVQFVAAEPYLALRAALLAFHRLTPEVVPGRAPSAIVDPAAEVAPTAQVSAQAVIEAGARIGAGACVGAGCIVGRGVQVGDESYLHPRVVLYPGVRLGRRVIVHSGVVLGADGFGYAPAPEGALKVPQIGGVLVEDDVEIGANTTIDRGTLGDTKIGRGTKIDNLVMIAHNVEIGRGCIIVSQVGIAGSSRVGDGAVIAGQVGIADHTEIGAGVTIAAKSGVHGDLEAGKTYMGSPAREASETRRIFAYMARLPEWAKRLRALEEQMVERTRASSST